MRLRATQRQSAAELSPKTRRYEIVGFVVNNEPACDRHGLAAATGRQASGDLGGAGRVDRGAAAGVGRCAGTLAALTGADLRLLGLALLVHYSGFAVRGHRWQLLLAAAGHRLGYLYVTAVC